MTTGLSGPLVLESDFAMQQMLLHLRPRLYQHAASSPVIIGDMAVQFPMNTASPQYVTSVFKHSVVSGSGSFIFWMRNNSVGPYTPDDSG